VKYVKKPIVVEAFQFGVDEEPEWFVDSNYIVDMSGEFLLIKDDFCDKRLVGSKGDMIIKGIQGEIYPCKKDIFDTTYDVCVEENEDG
jgi:hypothetical protein